MITIKSKTLSVGDKVQFRSGGMDTVTQVERRSGNLPVKITFASGEAFSHYAADGAALPSRGRSPHDIIDILKAALNFETLAAGTRLKYRGAISANVSFIANVSETKVVVKPLGYGGTETIVNKADLAAA